MMLGGDVFQAVAGLLGVCATVVNGYLIFQFRSLREDITSINKSRDTCQQTQYSRNDTQNVRSERIQKELSDYKVYVAEKYMSADAFTVAMAQIKGEIEKLRDLIVEQRGK